MNDKDPRGRDNLYSNPLQQVPEFTFDSTVAEVFPDMINRSVPGYSSVIAVTGFLARQFSVENTLIYDLGCSLGASSLAICQSAAPGCEVIAVDNSRAMIDRLSKRLEPMPNTAVAVRPMLADIASMEFKPASMIVMNYTLQFIAVSQRVALLTRLAEALIPGGILVLSEKIKLPEPQLDKLFNDLHHDFKRSNGYSELEISQKRDAIENVLIPESLDEHRTRLSNAGFDRIETWFQCFNFASMVAFK